MARKSETPGRRPTEKEFAVIGLGRFESSLARPLDHRRQASVVATTWVVGEMRPSHPHATNPMGGPQRVVVCSIPFSHPDSYHKRQA